MVIRKKQGLQINHNIRASRVLLISADGEKVGELDISSAMAQAKAQNLDLVEISPNANPPVCRIMDYGKHVFEAKKRRTQQKQKQHTVQVKEIKFRPTTDIGDYNIKLKRIISFIESGHRVKVTLRFRGREMQHREVGMSLLMRVQQDMTDVADVDTQPKLEGRQLTMLLVPKKK